MIKELDYSIMVMVYNRGGDIPVPEFCNSWTAVNVGDTACRVNNKLLKPFPPGHPELSGESFGVPGNKGEIYKDRLWIVFAAGGTTPIVEIAFKYYTKPEQLCMAGE